jgi:hypothetical protein
MCEVIKNYISSHPDSNLVIIFKGFLWISAILLLIPIGIGVTKITGRPIPIDCCTWKTFVGLLVLILLGAIAVFVMFLSIVVVVLLICFLYHGYQVCVGGCDEIGVIMGMIFRKDNYETINSTSNNDV